MSLKKGSDKLQTKRPVYKPKHVHHTDPVYRAWCGMMRRCYSTKSKDFKWYGGRGIGVVDRWKVFTNFDADMRSSFSVGLTLDRIDVNHGYGPGNCRWITMKAQCLNRTSNHLLTNPKTGETKTIQEWSERLGIKRGTMNSRICRGHTDFFRITAKQDFRGNRASKRADPFEKLTRQVAD